MKELRCRDVGYDCEAVVRGETVEDVLGQAAPHVKQVHGEDVTPEQASQIAGLIRDV